MDLIIDCGNTSIVFALCQNKELKQQWRISTNWRRTADEYGVWFQGLLSIIGLKMSDFKGAVISSVVPEATFHLKMFVEKYMHVLPFVVGEDNVVLGIQAFVDHPEDVGADRLVNAVAAQQIYGGPALVLDFGTATTFDILDKDSNYCGGAIVPGISLSLEALTKGAAKLPQVSLEKTDRLWSKSTVPAIQAGVFWGYLSMVEGLIDRLKKEVQESFCTKGLKTIATGGYSYLFKGSTDHIQIFDADLTLKGLMHIYDLNNGMKK